MEVHTELLGFLEQARPLVLKLASSALPPALLAVAEFFVVHRVEVDEPKSLSIATSMTRPDCAGVVQRTVGAVQHLGQHGIIGGGLCQQCRVAGC